MPDKEAISRIFMYDLVKILVYTSVLKAGTTNVVIEKVMFPLKLTLTTIHELLQMFKTSHISKDLSISQN